MQSVNESKEEEGSYDSFDNSDLEELLSKAIGDAQGMRTLMQEITGKLPGNERELEESQITLSQTQTLPRALNNNINSNTAKDVKGKPLFRLNSKRSSSRNRVTIPKRRPSVSSIKKL